MKITSSAHDIQNIVLFVIGGFQEYLGGWPQLYILCPGCFFTLSLLCSQSEMLKLEHVLDYRHHHLKL